MRYIALWMVAATLAAMTSCSTQQNTASSRWWHAFNARYNTYYNGKVAYIDGSLEKENGHKDNFTELLPLYPVGSKSSREIGKGNYDRAITKAEKVIHQHSIKRRPVWDKQRRKTAKDIECWEDASTTRFCGKHGCSWGARSFIRVPSTRRHPLSRT